MLLTARFDINAVAVFRLVTVALLALSTRALFGGAVPNGSFNKSGVVLDGSFGKSGALPGPNYLIPAVAQDGTRVGKQVGPNLFHSFSDFNLIKGDSATFTGPSNIQNVLSRVTGGSPSSIDGKISSQIQGANLFFLNPAGVMFGPNAQVDVSGSFAVSTANYVKLADGGRFNTSLGGADTLTSAPVSAFGFLGPTPASVNFDHSKLAVQPATGLHVIAGDVTLDGAKLTAPSGALTIFSAASPGEVSFNPDAPGAGYATASFSALGTVALINESAASISGFGGGMLVIRAGTLTVDNSTISSTNAGSTLGGDIDIQVDGELSVINAGQITASTIGFGDGGQIDISADQVRLAGIGSGISTNSVRPSTSITVSLDIEYPADGDLTISLTNPAGLVSLLMSRTGGSGHDIHTTFSDDAAQSITEGVAPFFGIYRPQGRQFGPTPLSGLDRGPLSGNWTLRVHVLTDADPAPRGVLQNWALTLGGTKFISVDVPQPIAIPSVLGKDFATSIIPVNIPSFTGGRVGDIDIRGRSVQVAEGATISANTFTDRNAGQVVVHAEEISISQGGVISTNSNGGPGDAGIIRLEGADSVLIEGNGTGIFAETLLGPGKAGEIVVLADSLRVEDHGAISTMSGSSVGGGSIQLGSPESPLGALTISEGFVFSEGVRSGVGGRIFINTTGPTHLTSPSLGFDAFGAISTSAVDGDAGDIVMHTGELLIGPGCHITSDTLGSGHGGDIFITAKSVSIDGEISAESTAGISATTRASGNAGNISVRTEDLSITDGAAISVESHGGGDAGSIAVTADSLFIDQTQGIPSFTADITGIFARTSVSGKGGDVSVDTRTAQIVNGGQISSGTTGLGVGGKLNVIVRTSLLIDGQRSGIFAETNEGSLLGHGDAGNVTVQGHNLTLKHGGQISSSTSTDANGGQVIVSADSLQIDGSSSGIFGDTRPVTFLDESGEIIMGPQRRGNAGAVTVRSARVTLTQGGEISSSTESLGNGGDVKVAAGSLFINGAGAPEFSTGILALADIDSTGDAGGITVRARHLKLANDGSVAADTRSNGKGGDVNVTADSLLLKNDGRIAATTSGSGDAGDIKVHAGDVKMKGGVIEARSDRTGAAGSIKVSSNANIRLNNDSTISVSAEKKGGNIKINVPILLSVIDSQITAEAGEMGGNITIDPIVLFLKRSSIRADAPVGQGGQIDLFTSFLVGPVQRITPDGSIFLAFNSSITATGGASSGTVNITAPALDLGAQLITLPASLVSAENQLRERCTALLQGDFSSFISIGRGGTEPEPDELESAF